MIQRKQTLFLLFSGIAMLVASFLPFAIYNLNEIKMYYTSTGFEDINSEIIVAHWDVFVLNMLVILLSFVTIFLYKTRIRQMRLTIFNLFLKVGFIGLVLYHLFDVQDFTFSLLLNSLTLNLLLPLAGIVLDILAYRFILMDELTIQSIYRLRK